MTDDNTQPELRRRANDLLGKALSPEEREALLIKSWMAHDARWFQAVAMAFGLEAANRVNQAAVHEAGKAEAKRMTRALRLPPVVTLDDWLLTQEAIIGLMGPDLIDYGIVPTGDDSYELRVERCFAHEQVTRAGVAQQYECGIMPRLTGWLEGLGLGYEMTPPLGKCLKAQGLDCVYAFKVRAPVTNP